MKFGLLGVSIFLGLSGVAKADQADAEYGRVKGVLARIYQRSVSDIFTNTPLTGVNDRGLIIYVTQTYRDLRLPAINTQKVFDAVQVECIGNSVDRVAGYITPGCLTDAILDSRRQ